MNFVTSAYLRHGREAAEDTQGAIVCIESLEVQHKHWRAAVQRQLLGSTHTLTLTGRTVVPFILFQGLCLCEGIQAILQTMPYQDLLGLHMGHMCMSKVSCNAQDHRKIATHWTSQTE